MIDCIQNIDKHNPFAEYNRKGSYYLTQETANDIFVESEKNKDKKGRKVGIIIAASSLAAGLLIFAATKGLPKNTYKWLEKLSESLENKVNTRKLQGRSGPVTFFYRYLLQKAGGFGEKSKSVNNFTSFKDISFGKLMYKNKITRNIHTNITSFFERMAKSTVNKSYAASDSKFDKLFKTYADLNNRITRTVPGASEAVREITERQARVKAKYAEGFGVKAREDRYLRMKDAVEGLSERVWEVFKKRSPKTYTTFVSENELAADKISLTKDVDKLRHEITHDILDSYRVSKQAVDNIASFLNPRDEISSQLLKTLREKLATYKKLSGPSEQLLREKVNAEIASILKNLSERLKVSDFHYNDAAVKQVVKYVDDIAKTLGKSSKGELQEILTLYKSILPPKEYAKLRTKTYSAIKAFDNAIKIENDQFFDKLRDLRLGSAPTDILSILGSVGGAGLGLTLADNNDERISAALKYGIPIIGGVATSVAMTVCLISGLKAMAAGFLSSVLINRAGVYTDKFRKQYNKKQEDAMHAEAVKAQINETKV